jgi:hypothetical protein
MAGRNLLAEGAPKGRNLLAQQQPSIPWSDVTGMAIDNFGSSAKKAGSDFVQPFIHPIDTAKALGTLAAGTVGKMVPDSWGGRWESEDVADAVGKHFSDRYGGSEELKRTIATDPAGFLLDASTILSGGGALAAKLPGVAGKVGSFMKAIDPVTVPFRAAGKVIQGVNNPAAKRLLSQGVVPTIGQAIGGVGKTIEDVLESVPVLGNVIRGSRKSGMNQMNLAAYDRALEPIGKTSKGLEASAAGVAEVKDALSAAYGDLLPKLSLTPDAGLAKSIGDAVVAVQPMLDANQSSVLVKLVKDKIVNKIRSGNPLTGEQIKVIESELNTLAETFGKSSSAGDKFIGKSLEDIQQALRDALTRSNPEHASRLSDINKGYANYVRIRNAGKAAGADINGFSPAQLRSAVSSSDKSVGKGSTAAGRALMQDLSADANKVMGGNLPNSGTVDRAMMALAPAAIVGSVPFSPILAGMGAAAVGPYIPGVKNAMAHALLSRPAGAKMVGDVVGGILPNSMNATLQAGRNQRIQEENVPLSVTINRKNMQNALGAN